MLYQTIGSERTEWAGKTAPEIRGIGKEDGSILLIPVGSIEQHGEHLPVSTDTILVDAVAHHGSEQVADNVPILVTPPVWSGFSPHHMSFGGTLTLEYRHLLSVLENIASAGLQNGFDAVLMLNGHGGNKSLIDSAVSTIGEEHEDTEVLGLTYFDLAQSFADEIRESKTGGMAHGGEFETSLMQHLRPDMVKKGGDATYWDEPYELGGDDLLSGGPLSVYRPFEEYSESGAIGDPSLANAEKGAEILDRLEAEMAELLTDIHHRNT